MKQREYETIFIVRPDVADDEHTRIVDRLRGVIETKGGSMLREENWGKRKLAYEVKKHLKGFYHFFQYGAPNDTVAQLEWTMKMIEPVIKYQTVKLGDDIDIETRREEIRVEIEEAAKPREEDEDRPRRSRDDDDDEDSDDDDADDKDDIDDKE